MKQDNEYPQQFTTVAQVELYARKLNEVSIRQTLAIESLNLHVKDLEKTVAELQTRLDILADDPDANQQIYERLQATAERGYRSAILKEE